MRALFDPAGLRPHVVNWEETARTLLARVRREATLEGDAKSKALLADLVRACGFPPSPADTPPNAPQATVIPVEIRAGDAVLRFFTTITTVGAPQDIILAELRIEAFHPADTATDAIARAMAGA